MDLSFGRWASRRTAIKVTAGLLAISACASGAQATEGFPSKIIRFIVPVGPGSNTDVVARWVADRTSAVLGVPAIVDNKPGGEMLIGMRAFL